MAKRWFGPQPLELSFAHGSCGCCGCGGFASEDEFIKYAAYRNGLRMKLVIAGVPDGFTCSLNSGGTAIYITTATGMSGYNGTWYFDIIRSQYGCIFNALDFDTFDVGYVATDPDFYPLGVPYTQTVRIRPRVFRPGATFLSFVYGSIEHYSSDYEFGASPLVAGYTHPMIGLAFEPTDVAYSTNGGLITEPGLLIESHSAIWRADQLTEVISGNLRFFLSDALVDQSPMSPAFTDPIWQGIGTFWDTATSDFKIAGTFTLEIERL